MKPSALEMSRAEARSLWSQGTLGPSFYEHVYAAGGQVFGSIPPPSTWVEDPPSE